MKQNKIIRYIIAIISVFGIAFCVAAFFPTFQRIIIGLTEQFILRRKITNPLDLWMSRVPFYARAGITVILIIDFFVLTSWGRALFFRIRDEITQCLRKIDSRALIKPFLLISAVYFLGILTIIRANFLYIDDVPRAIRGYQGWHGWSRYLSNVLATFIHTHIHLTDISPLPQLFAVLFLALSSIIVVYSVCDKKINVSTLLASVPLGLSPYFLSCVSFKFDAPYMALSILASVVPFLFIDSKRAFMATSVIGLLVMCMTYQAASGIYLLIVLMLCFRDWNYERKTLKAIMDFALTSAISFVFALLFFRFFLMTPSEGGTATTMLPFSRILPGFISNLQSYAGVIYGGFAAVWKIVIALVIIYFIVQSVKLSKQRKFIAVAVSGFLVIISFVLSYGAYLFLERPFLGPRALYGFGVFLSLIMICLVSYRKKKGVILALMMSWCFFVFAFSYGNALADQKRYVDFRLELLLHDLSDVLPERKTNLLVQIAGNAGYAPSIKNISGYYPIIEQLVPQMLVKDGWEGLFYLTGHFNWGTWESMSFSADNEYDFASENLPVLIDSYYHTIRSDGEHALVIFKQGAE